MMKAVMAMLMILSVAGAAHADEGVMPGGPHAVTYSAGGVSVSSDGWRLISPVERVDIGSPHFVLTRGDTRADFGQ